MLVSIPLTDEERAAVDDGQSAWTPFSNVSPTWPPPTARPHANHAPSPVEPCR
ncbi:hypothetical protein ACIBLA_10205 [Streptomyces sp. NPDC050433]|uniref:hypothetical protein n=1 Tax=Streptomyces sp. NPDC050433 TaxID=3365615 RepID=UPI0037B51721